MKKYNKAVPRELSRSCAGMTIVELIIGFAIVGIFVVTVLSMQLFNLNVFGQGAKKADIQAEVNIASEAILTQIRYSSAVEILPATATIPDPVLNDDSYMFIDTTTGMDVLKVRDKSGDRTLQRFEKLSITFEPMATNKSLRFSLAGEKGGQNFSTDSDVVALNMLLTPNNILDSSGASDGVALRFSALPPNVVVTPSFSLPQPSVGTVGVTYDYVGWTSYSNAGYVFPYTYGVSVGTPMPDGLSLVSSTGRIHGEPTVAGVYPLMITVQDSSSPAKTVNALTYITIGGTVPSPSPTTSPPASGTPPAVNNVVISGLVKEGATVTTTYTYSDTDGDIESGSVVNWYTSTNASGNPKSVIGSGLNFMIPSSTSGLYLIAGVTPSSSNASEGAGQEAFSTATLINPVNSKPHASGLKLSKVDSTLSVEYIYSDYDNDQQSTALRDIKWFYNDKGVLVEISSLEDHISYNVPNNEKAVYFTVKLTPAALTGVTYGDTQTSTEVRINP